MVVIAWMFASLAAAIHIAVWAFESFLIERPFVYRGVFRVPASTVAGARLWAFGLGFYNLFLGLGMLLGVALWAAGVDEPAGRTLVLYIAAFMALCGVVLFAADRMGLGRERGTGVGGSIGQSVPPLIALGATLLA